jgi:hypothetical protein
MLKGNMTLLSTLQGFRCHESQVNSEFPEMNTSMSDLFTGQNVFTVLFFIEPILGKDGFKIFSKSLLFKIILLILIITVIV